MGRNPSIMASRQMKRDLKKGGEEEGEGREGSEREKNKKREERKS